jgi:5'-nucleotidase
MKKKPLILISNDDGITSKGIRTLAEIMAELGEVVVVAPSTPQSGMGHAITVNNMLRLDKSDVFEDIGVEAYECSGTPADCVKLAKHHVLKDRKPDLVVSGINHGSNSSVSVLYSGTMSAAIEAALEGLPAIGFSLCDYAHNADFSHIRHYTKKIASEAIEKGIPANVALNVNFPSIIHGDIQGIKICRQAKARWQENFEERKDPYGRVYYWLVGDFINEDAGLDTDVWALDNGFISIVPCKYDMTAYESFPAISQWDI